VAQKRIIASGIWPFGLRQVIDIEKAVSPVADEYAATSRMVRVSHTTEEETDGSSVDT
jgi:hypothetical protein